MNPAASVALIILIIESMLFVSLFLVIMAALVYGMVQVRRFVKRFMPKAQNFTSQVVVVTRQASDKVAAPFIWVHATHSNVRALARGIRKRLGLQT